MIPDPVDLGMPSKFTSWRRMQAEAVIAGMDSPKRFVFQAAPTGFGKSPTYVAQALLSGARTCILTSTKGLQTQLIDDFGSCGLVDIRGMNAYKCNAAESEFGMISNRWIGCDEGPCRSGLKCTLRQGGCSYYDAYEEAKTADLVVTNYAYWMNINRYGEGIGVFDLLVMDEGHNAPDELSNFLAVELESIEIEQLLGSRPVRDGASIDDWKEWAAYHSPKVDARLDALQVQINNERQLHGRLDHAAMRQIYGLRRLQGKLKSIAGMKGQWVYEKVGKRWQFDPVWPAEYAESSLFRNTPKVVVFSATIRPKTAAILGIKPADLEFREYPSTFPNERRPVYHVETCQVNHRTTDVQLRQWVTRADQIMRLRQDRNGLFHTTSFARQRFVLQESEFSDIMFHNESGNTRTVVEAFKQAEPPAVFVSPSLTTGWDFPYETCHYQIIGKIPFPDGRSEVMKARSASDKDYPMFLAMTVLVQTAGRGMRAEDDYCETIIIDDSIRWFLFKYKHFAPKWFIDSFKSLRTVPRPLPIPKAKPKPARPGERLVDTG